MSNKENNKNFLVIYGIIILIVLVLIMFIIPDDIFMLKYKDVELPSNNNSVEKKEFVSLDEQKEKLLNGNYDYSYVLLDSMGSKTYQYNCEGKIKDDMETGTCTEPNSFSYTENSKKESFKISIKYLDIKEIFELIKDSQEEVTNYQTIREINYKVKIDDLDTDIMIYTDIENITRIDISNAYMTYILKFNNIT